MKREPINLLLYRWRYAIGYTALILVFMLAIALAGLYAPGGLTQSEIDTLAVTHSLGSTTVNLVNLPFHGLQLLSLKLFGVSILTIKLPAMLFAVGAIVAIFFLLRRWFKPNITILAMLIMATTGQLIFLAQSATTQILYVFYSALILLFASLILQKAQKPLLWRLALATSVALSIYTPYFFYINAGLLIAAFIHPRTRYHILRRSQRLNWLGAGALFVLLMSPLVLGIIKDSTILHELAGLSYLSSLDVLDNVKTLFQTYFWVQPVLVNDQIAPIFDFTSLFIIVLGGLALFRHRYTARSYVITGWLLLTLPILIIDPGLVALVVVPLFILLALGIETLLHEWYKLFPKNPYARSFGLILAVGLIGIMVFSGIDRFMNGYRHMPEAAGNSSVDLVLLKQHLAQRPAKVQIIATETELPLYHIYARFSKDEVIVTSDVSERASTNILVSHAAREQLNRDDLELTAIITNDRSADGDRFYLYKVK